MMPLRMMGLLACACVAAGASERLPEYRARQSVNGTIRIWGHGALGHDFMETLVHDWETGFRAAQPRVRFETRLHGTASAIGALYTGAGDLALMGREIRPFEIDAFREVMHHAPLGIEVVTGSFDIKNKDFALGVFIHRANPLAHLTPAQVESIFGCEHRLGGPDIRTWGDLGLTGEWANQPLHVYGYQIWRGFADFFAQAALAGSHKWNPALFEVRPTRSRTET